MPLTSTPSASAASLELDGAGLTRLLAAITERLAAHVDSLPAQPAADVAGAADLAAELLGTPFPEWGVPLEEVLELLFERAIPKSFNTAGPGYLAYIPGGGVLHAAAANLIADVTNRYVGVWQAAPALVTLETNVVRWLRDLAGLPAGSGGFLSSGGSLATFSALVTARRERLPEEFLGGLLYASDQVHHCIQKAALLAGFPLRNVRSIPTDAQFRIRLDLLAERIAADRAAGGTPFLVVGNAGSTNTGAVDDLASLADLAARESLWLHVDAAYGGFFLLTERGRRAMAGIERADSIVLDPHKGLFLPYGTGALLVRDAGALRRAHSVGADYLPRMQDEDGRVDWCEVSPELSRDFRGLRVWLPLMLCGVGAFRAALDEKLDLALFATEELRSIPGIEIVAEPQLSLVAFRLAPPGVTGPALDALNRDFLARVNARQRVHLSATVLERGFVLRICVLSFRTHRDRMEAGLDDIRESAREISASR